MKNIPWSRFRFLIIPLVFLATLLLLGLLYQVFNLPSAEEFLNIGRNYYATYGYWVVFIAALVEGLLFINWYLPGSAVAVLGVVFARENHQSAALVIFLIFLAFLITAVINYALGRFGWYRLFLKFGLRKPLEEAHLKVEKAGLALIFSSYIHPNLGALTATSAGILRLNFLHFLLYSTLALAIWESSWGILMYYYGSELLEWGTVNIMVVIVVVWCIYLAFKNFRSEKSASQA